jgi:Tetratricopeptide repeat
MHHVAIQLGYAGQHAEAAALHQWVLQAEQRLLEPQHPHTLASMTCLAEQLNILAQQADAAQLYQHALQATLQDFGAPAEHLNVVSEGVVDLVAQLARLQQQTAAPEKQLLPKMQCALDPEQLGAFSSTAVQAEEHASAGRHQDAVQLLQLALPDMQRVLGPEHTLTLRTAASLGRQLCLLAQFVEAAQRLQQALGEAQAGIQTNMATAAGDMSTEQR